MRVRVLSPLEHDGTRYEIGHEAEISSDVAAALELLGVVEIVVAAPPEPVKKTRQPRKPRTPTPPQDEQS